MWTAYIGSIEKRADLNLYISVEFYTDTEKRQKEYLINSSKTLAQFKDDLKREIQGFSYDTEILALKPGVIDLG